MRILFIYFLAYQLVGITIKQKNEEMYIKMKKMFFFFHFFIVDVSDIATFYDSKCGFIFKSIFSAINHKEITKK